MCWITQSKWPGARPPGCPPAPVAPATCFFKSVPGRPVCAFLDLWCPLWEATVTVFCSKENPLGGRLTPWRWDRHQHHSCLAAPDVQLALKKHLGTGWKVFSQPLFFIPSHNILLQKLRTYRKVEWIVKKVEWTLKYLPPGWHFALFASLYVHPTLYPSIQLIFFIPF